MFSHIRKDNTPCACDILLWFLRAYRYNTTRRGGGIIRFRTYAKIIPLAHAIFYYGFYAHIVIIPPAGAGDIIRFYTHSKIIPFTRVLT